MKEAVPRGEGGMVAILGSTPSKIEQIISENKNNYECFIANDNSTGQQVVSGKLNNLDLSIGGNIFNDDGYRMGEKTDRKRLMDYRKIYSPKWIMIFLLVPIYVTLFSQGVKFFKNEFLTLTIMGLFIFMTALFA